MLECALVSEHVELFHYFHFFASLWAIRYVEHFGKSESAGTPEYIANIILLTNVMQQQVSLRHLFLHL